MGDDDDRSVALRHPRGQIPCPLEIVGVIPIILADTLYRGERSFPVALPIIRPGIMPTGERKNVESIEKQGRIPLVSLSCRLI